MHQHHNLIKGRKNCGWGLCSPQPTHGKGEARSLMYIRWCHLISHECQSLTLHLHKEFCLDAFRCFWIIVTSGTAQWVYFINEDNGWFVFSCQIKQILNQPEIITIYTCNMLATQRQAKYNLPCLEAWQTRFFMRCYWYVSKRWMHYQLLL